MKFPSTRLPLAKTSPKAIASPAVGRDHVGRRRRRPADRVADDSSMMSIPSPALPMATVPVMSVPIRFPWIRLSPKISEVPKIPPPPLFEMTLPARGRRPADRVVARVHHPDPVAAVAQRPGARDVRADEVALDEVVRRA